MIAVAECEDGLWLGAVGETETADGLVAADLDAPALPFLGPSVVEVLDPAIDRRDPFDPGARRRLHRAQIRGEEAIA